jgi:hypothetical protein
MGFANGLNSEVLSWTENILENMRSIPGFRVTQPPRAADYRCPAIDSCGRGKCWRPTIAPRET